MKSWEKQHRQKIQIFIGWFSILFVLVSMGNTAAVDDESTLKVYLNHFFLLVDSATYKDIVASNFIKNEFAHFEERTTVVNNNESYSGAYIYGENTYFELFDEAKSQRFMPQGLISGIALGVEKKDEIKIIQKKLKDYKNGVYALRSREWNGVQIPWFTMTFVFYGNTAPDVMTWVMEYHEDFLKKWHPELTPTSPGIARNDIIERYAANIAKTGRPKDKIFRDVIEVDLRLNPNDLKALKGELSVLGFAFSEEGNTKIGSGPDVMVVIDVIEEGKGKITGIKMSCCSNQYKEKTFFFGEKSRLVLHADNTATWTFE